MANPKAARSSSTSTSAPTALTALEAEIAELRATLAEQRVAFTQVIEQQQAAITDLRQAVASRMAPGASQAECVAPVVPVVEADAPQPAVAAATESEAESAAPRPSRNTSRRGLLRGAAAGAAAAAVAAVAVGGAQSAHAAPLATGNNWVLGNGNDADATTSLSPSSGSAPNPLLRVDNSANLAVGIEGWSASFFGGVNGSGYGAGTGVYASSDTGNAVFAFASSGVALNAAGTGRIAQNIQGSAGAPTSGTYSIGEQIRDNNGEMWICTASGSPGTWARVAHVDAGGTGGAITFLSKPIRLLDTRSGQPAAIQPNAKLTPGDHYFPVNGTNYNSVLVSNNTTGILGNLTILNATGSGFIAVCPANVGFSNTANLAFTAGQTLSNAYTTAVGLYITGVYPFWQFHTGIDIYVSGASLDVIIDIMAIVL